jgi:hypothetical protein
LAKTTIGGFFLHPSGFQKLKECKRCEGDDPAARRAIIVRRIKWFFGISANCILVLVGRGSRRIKTRDSSFIVIKRSGHTILL